jgi:hypothetical protein
MWASLAEPLSGAGPVWVAVEDDYGLGAAVAAAARLEDGRIEVDGWRCQDWDAAVHDVRVLCERRWVNEILAGASLVGRLPDLVPEPVPAGGKETRAGLAVLRELAFTGQVAHDQATYDLDDAIDAAMVREAPTGLYLVAKGATHLVRAAAWAVQAAHRLETIPAVY